MFLSECCHFVKGRDPVADAFASTVYSDIVNLENFHHVTFVVYCGVGTTGTSTFTVEPCLSAGGTPATAVPFHYREITTGDTPGTLTAATAAGFTSTAGSSKIILIEVDAQALGASGYGWIRLKAVEIAAAAVLGCILIILSDSRYAQNVQDTAIA